RVCFTHGVADHHPLVAGALPVEVGFRLTLALFHRVVDALRDVRGLLLDGDRDPAGFAVEAVLRPRVADVDHGLAHDRRDVDVRRCGDLAGDAHQTGCDQCLACHPSERV